MTSGYVSHCVTSIAPGGRHPTSEGRPIGFGKGIVPAAAIDAASGPSASSSCVWLIADSARSIGWFASRSVSPSTSRLRCRPYSVISSPANNPRERRRSAAPAQASSLHPRLSRSRSAGRPCSAIAQTSKLWGTNNGTRYRDACRKPRRAGLREEQRQVCRVSCRKVASRHRRVRRVSGVVGGGTWPCRRRRRRPCRRRRTRSRLARTRPTRPRVAHRRGRPLLRH